MRRGNEAGAQVSFLFFIDIIMAISGVMLFVIMMLILDLSPTDVHVPGQLSVKEATAQNKALREQIETLQPRLDEVKRSLASAGDFSATTAQLKETIGRLGGGADDAPVLKKRLQEAGQKARELNAEIEELKHRNGNLNEFKKVAFQFGQQDSDRDVVVIECSTERLVVQIPGTSVPPHIIQGDSRTCTDGVLKDLSALNAEKIAILVVVKPSAFEWAGALVAFIRSKSYLTGIEPLEEDRTAIKW